MSAAEVPGSVATARAASNENGPMKHPIRRNSARAARSSST